MKSPGNLKSLRAYTELFPLILNLNNRTVVFTGTITACVTAKTEMK